jgi:hypothetical protein
LHVAWDREARWVRAVFVLESPPEPSGEWADLERVTIPDLPEALWAAYRAERQSGLIPEGRVPWARPGWFAEASAWIRERLGAVERLEQVKTWGISCVLRAVTPEGDFFFKVSTRQALFADEPGVTQALAEASPT